MSKYTMIRVSRQTQQRLAAFRDKLFADYVAGIVDLPDGNYILDAPTASPCQFGR